MSGSDMLILGVVAVLVVLIAVRYIKRVRAGGCSCGCDEGGEGRGRVEKAPVADRDETHYPYVLDLVVGGMSCAGCVANVENALNAQPGTWATAQLSGDVRVRGKEPLDADACEAAIKAAGYYVKKL